MASSDEITKDDKEAPDESNCECKCSVKMALGALIGIAAGSAVTYMLINSAVRKLVR